MTKEEIKHLGTLSRIRLSDTDAEKFMTEIDAIIGYVSSVNDIVAESDLTKVTGPVFNVFREDEVTNEPGAYSEVLIAEFPDKEGNHLKVKKILTTDD